MRIAIPVLALALLPAAALAGERDAPKPAAKLGAACENARVDMAVKGGQPARIRRLDQEPLAGQYLGVIRYEDGCDKPVKIAGGVGDRQR